MTKPYHEIENTVGETYKEHDKQQETDKQQHKRANTHKSTTRHRETNKEIKQTTTQAHQTLEDSHEC